MRAGDEVICIDATPPIRGGEHFKNWIEQNKLYTIRKVEGSLGGNKRLLLEEVVNPLMDVVELGGKAEPGFSHKRFTYLDGTPLMETVQEKEEALQ